ncbi:PRC-barrel domain-containing protein [Pedobacter sp. V48]|uniref:PRC-barrel domain-containing protein n=1 Tax=Pedobacter sp. V48 TaxID=509635 RepID=UPI00126952A9|nr:PRC-barrel domain-containing protein [Pedobacter sp. V48]
MIESRVPLEASIAARNKKGPGDPHLRSISEVKRYHIHATDGEIGDVTDIIVDEHWIIRFLIVDTGSWFPGKKVLLSPEWIKEVSWADSSVEVDVSVEAVKNSPKYNPNQPLAENYETDLFLHYDK